MSQPDLQPDSGNVGEDEPVLETAPQERYPRAPRRWVLALGVALTVVLLGAAAILVLQSRRPIGFTQVFDMPIGSLDGQPARGEVRWSVVGGVFDSDGQGLMGRPDRPPSPAVATVDLGSPVKSVSVTMRDPDTSAGIVFRYQDPSNYWTLVAAPFYANWVIYARTNGQTRYVGSTEGLDLDTRLTTQVVTLTFRNATVDVDVNGRLRQRLVSSELQQAPGVGFVASANGSTRWDEITVRAD